MGEADGVQEPYRYFGACPCRQGTLEHRHLDVFERRQCGQQQEGLEDEADLLSAVFIQVAIGGQWLAFEHHLAVGKDFAQVHGLQQPITVRSPGWTCRAVVHREQVEDLRLQVIGGLSRLKAIPNRRVSNCTRVWKVYCNRVFS